MTVHRGRYDSYSLSAFGIAQRIETLGPNEFELRLHDLFLPQFCFRFLGPQLQLHKVYYD